MGMVAGRATILGFSRAVLGIAPTTSAAAEEKKEEEELKPKVKVMRVTRSVVSPRIVCFGVARGVAGTDIVLTARVAAVVSQVLHGVGDHVEAGDVVLRLDARSFTAAREKAEGALYEVEAELAKGKRGALEIELAGFKAGLKQAETDSDQAERAYNRQKTLETDGLVSKRQVEEAKNALDVALLRKEAAVLQLERAEHGLQAEELLRLKARVAQARADLDSARLQENFAEVRAPIAGTLSELDVTPGTNVDATTPLARVVAPSTIEALLSVPSEQARKIAPGADVRLLAGGEEVARATVTGVGAGAAVDGTVKLRASVADARMVANVLPGTPLAAEIALGKIEALCVPKEALVLDTDRTVVITLYKKPDDKNPKEMLDLSKKVPVKVICIDGNVIAIEAKLEVDDRVVTENAYNLPDNTEVDVDE